MKTEQFTPKFVETFPCPMSPAVLYISVEYNSCGHLCACGCGEEVVAPLSPAQWSFTYDGATVSMRPSIGSWALPCRSHYVIDHNRVRWAKQYSDDAIALNRARDRAALDPGHARDPEAAPPATPHAAPGEPTGAAGPLTRFVDWLRRCQ
jgi:hypothetical protein